MSDAISWVIAHYGLLLGAAGAAAALFVAVAKLTPTPKDDEIAAEVQSAVKTVGDILAPKSPAKPEDKP